MALNLVKESEGTSTYASACFDTSSSTPILRRKVATGGTRTVTYPSLSFFNYIRRKAASYILASSLQPGLILSDSIRPIDDTFYWSLHASAANACPFDGDPLADCKNIGSSFQSESENGERGADSQDCYSKLAVVCGYITFTMIPEPSSSSVGVSRAQVFLGVFWSFLLLLRNSCKRREDLRMSLPLFQRPVQSGPLGAGLCIKFSISQFLPEEEQ
ncbi:uncharacterized protein MYCFIDRAFT_180521 [Pseudocercospora fijiensis CIRAD86]|uniref:Uncharacterized protein n=1 Tax=Pseudocercospora fijiensis (strain CIRAD86) TaxID=383855 RepID=M2YGC4_PSEFD|nr:uncharacterized protein MYCFIDRAFT_180521 [Pseudocercospora fijiensis CIRAD86]EME76855.1 hypothetical protein MYCFIDRAFT_180521 [Pseudocercospora fijiensis CIRAD86]